MKLEVNKKLIFPLSDENWKANPKVIPSSNDISFPPSLTNVLYLFPQGSQKHFNVNKVEQTLSQTLSLFPILAGRRVIEKKIIKSKKDGTEKEVDHMWIDCNYEIVEEEEEKRGKEEKRKGGVAFYFVKSDQTINEFMKHYPLKFDVEHLPNDVSYYIFDEYNPDALMRVQLTHFSDSSVGLSAGFNHTLCDGESMSFFFKTWSQIYKGDTYELPFDDRTLLLSNGDLPKFEHNEYRIIETKISIDQNIREKEEDVKLEDVKEDAKDDPGQHSLGFFHFSKESLDKLKKDFSPKNVSDSSEPSWVSTNDALTALMWRAVSRVRNFKKETNIKCGMAVNGRERYNPKIPPLFFGNATFFSCFEAKSETLTNQNNPALISQLVRKNVNKMDSEYLKSAIDWIGNVEDISAMGLSFQKTLEIDFTVTNWTTFGWYNHDFGFQSLPVYVGLPVIKFHGIALYINSPLTSETSGAITVQLLLAENQLKKLHQDEELKKYLH